MNVKLARMAGGGGGGAAGVVPFSGEVQECDVDMIIPGRGLDFIWARTYIRASDAPAVRPMAGRIPTM